MERKQLNIIKNIFIFILIQFVLDFIYSRLLLANSLNILITGLIIKGIKLLFLIYLIYTNIYYKDFKVIKICLVFGLVIGIGFLSLSPINNYSIGNIFREWLLYCTPLLLLNVFYKQNEIHSKEVIYIKYSTLLILLVSCTVFVGFLFKIEMFRTYEDGLRFGYMGILHKSIHASYFFISSLFFLYYFSIYHRYLSSIYFWFVLACSLVVGTKAIYLFLVLLLGYAFFHHKLYVKKQFQIILVSICSGVLLFSNRLLKHFQETFFVLVDVYKEKGLLTSLLSYRNEIVEIKLNEYISQWTAINFLFGGKIFPIGLFEVDILDLFVLAGLVGSMIYLYAFYNCINTTLIGKDKIIKIYYIISLLIVSNLAGQLFNNFSSTLYVIWIYYLINSNVFRTNQI